MDLECDFARGTVQQRQMTRALEHMDVGKLVHFSECILYEISSLSYDDRCSVESKVEDNVLEGII
jgi:hypothetical protein